MEGAGGRRSFIRGGGGGRGVYVLGGRRSYILRRFFKGGEGLYFVQVKWSTHFFSFLSRSLSVLFEWYLNSQVEEAGEGLGRGC